MATKAHMEGQSHTVATWFGVFLFYLLIWNRVYIYRQTSTKRRAKSQNSNVYRLVLQLSMLNPLKQGVKLRVKMWLEQRRCSNYIWVINILLPTMVLILEVWRYEACGWPVCGNMLNNITALWTVIVRQYCHVMRYIKDISEHKRDVSYRSTVIAKPKFRFKCYISHCCGQLNNNGTPGKL